MYFAVTHFCPQNVLQVLKANVLYKQNVWLCLLLAYYKTGQPITNSWGGLVVQLVQGEVMVTIYK